MIIVQLNNDVQTKGDTGAVNINEGVLVGKDN